MKLICQKIILDTAINNSIKAINSNTTLPILSGILLIAKNNKLKIIGNNLNIGIETTIDELTILEEGSVVVDAKFFSNIIKKLPNGPITFEYKENEVNVEHNEIHFNLVGTPANEYPELPTIEENNTYQVDSVVLKQMIKQTIFATSNDEARPILNGILFKFENNKLTLVALDGYRLAYKNAIQNIEIPNEVIIPSDTLKEVSKILSSDSDVTISVTDKHVLITIDNIRIISRLLEGDFINYNQIMPDKFNSKMIVDKNKFKNAIERSQLLTQENKNAPVKFEISDNLLYIKSIAETGQLDEKLKVKYENKNLVIGFNPNYLLDALKVIDTEKIEINFINSISPAIINPIGDESYTYLIVPVRLS